jgi:hypothetical protein
MQYDTIKQNIITQITVSVLAFVSKKILKNNQN